MNGSEQVPEGVRIPRPNEYPARDFPCCDHALIDEEYEIRRRTSDLAGRFYALGYHSAVSRLGVLLTEDAARAVLARLEEGK
jgi:hypothetical protein